MGIGKKQLMELEMSAKNKNFFNGAFKGIFITALSFSLFASLAANAADANNPIATGAAEKTAPTPVLEEPEKVNIEINPTTTIAAPMAYHIPYLQSLIDIKADGSAVVTENFFVVVPKAYKDQPLSRELPNVIKTPFGKKRVKAIVTKVMHNNSLAPFKIVPKGETSLIKILSAEKGLESGVHYFSVQYYVHSAVKTIGNNDTFFWAISGIGWTIPMTRVAIMVNHPNNIEPTGQSIFLDNAPDTKIKNVARTGTTYNFIRNGALYPTQSLVLIETFPKGSFTGFSKSKNFLSLDISNLSFFLGLIFVSAYYLILWFTASTEKRAIADPSQNAEKDSFFSPAGFRVFLKKSFDTKALLALILNLAHKGFLKIEDHADGSFTLVRQATPGKEARLSKGEKSFFSHLFTKGRLAADLDGNTGARLTKHRRNFELPFFLEYDKQFFKINYSYFLFGISITLFTIIFSAALSGNPFRTGAISASLAFAILFAISSVFGLRSTIRTPAHQGKIAKILILFLLFAVFSILSVFYAYSMVINLSAPATIFLGLMITLLSLAYHFMKSENKLGKAVREKSNMYIDYLKLGTPLPEAYKADVKKGVETFSRSLPFAIASENEATFIRRFASLLDIAKEPLPWLKTEKGTSAANIADFLVRLEKQITSSFAFLNPKIQRFR